VKWGDPLAAGANWKLPFKVGFLDLNILRASARVNPYTGWVASWLDGYDGMEEIPVCDYYVYIGDPDKLKNLPAGTWARVGDEIRLYEHFTDLPSSDIVPHLEKLPGWPKTRVAGISDASQLPGEAWNLIRFVEEGLNMPGSIVMLSTGEDNSHTVFLRNRF
jgi:adenylosuccinate synthase